MKIRLNGHSSREAENLWLRVLVITPLGGSLRAFAEITYGRKCWSLTEEKPAEP